jgi:hypothetical protein
MFMNITVVWYRIKEEGNILHTVRRRKANWVGYILRRNCLLSHIIGGKIIGTRRRGRRRTQSSCWMTSRKQKDTGSWRRKLRIKFFGELSLEEAMDLSQDRLLLELVVWYATRWIFVENQQCYRGTGFFLHLLSWRFVQNTVVNCLPDYTTQHYKWP